MRELSIVELELIVGGYDSGGGGGGDYYDGSGESYGNSSFTYGANGEVTGNISSGDQSGINDAITTAGISISEIPITIEVGPIKATFKLPGSKKKK